MPSISLTRFDPMCVYITLCVGVCVYTYANIPMYAYMCVHMCMCLCVIYWMQNMNYSLKIAGSWFGGFC